MGPARLLRTENLSSGFEFTCLQVFCSKKGGQNNKGEGPRRGSDKGSKLGVMTRQLRCLFALLAGLFVIYAASPERCEGVGVDGVF